MATGKAAGSSASEFDTLASETYRTWEKAMTAWWDQVLESPAFLGAVNSGLGGAAQSRGAYTRGVDQFLTQAHLPTREDIVRLLRVTTQLEDRLLAQEDILLRLGDDVRSAEKATLEARIQSAEAQIALEERLAAIEARLEGGIASDPTASEPSTPNPTPRRRR